jgi:hypothetical protein
MSDRKPYAERERQIAEWCLCQWVMTEGADGQTIRHEIYRRNHACPLHGHNAKPTPF